MLTAAHCFINVPPNHLGIKVCFGSDSKQIVKAQCIAASRYIIHPEYTKAGPVYKDTGRNDIAIIETEYGIPFDSKTYPICLPSAEFCLDEGNIVEISGWGSIEKDGTYADGSFPDSLMYDEVEVQHENSTCGVDAGDKDFLKYHTCAGGGLLTVRFKINVLQFIS